MRDKNTIADPEVQQALIGIIVILIEKLYENPYFGWSSRARLAALRGYIQNGDLALDELRALAEALREVHS